MTIKKDQIIDVLKEVIEPTLGIDIISLNMISDINCINNSVHVIFKPTSYHCPVAINIGLAIKRKLQSIDKIVKVEVMINDHVDENKVNKIISEA